MTSSYSAYLNAATAEADVEEFLGTLFDKVTPDLVKAWESYASYEGFNPQYVRWKCMKEYSNDPEKLIQLMVIGLVRGNNVATILTSINDTGKAILREGERKLDLKSSAKKNKEWVSLSRICIAFPTVSCSLMKSIKVMPVSATNLTPNYPDVMRHSCFSALLVPQELCTDYKLIYEAYALYQYKFMMLVGTAEDKAQSVEQKKDRIANFAAIGENGSNISSEDRISFLKNWGILTTGGS